jgi:hypothetical protein
MEQRLNKRLIGEPPRGKQQKDPRRNGSNLHIELPPRIDNAARRPFDPVETRPF